MAPGRSWGILGGAPVGGPGVPGPPAPRGPPPPKTARNLDFYMFVLPVKVFMFFRYVSECFLYIWLQSGGCPGAPPGRPGGPLGPPEAFRGTRGGGGGMVRMQDLVRAKGRPLYGSLNSLSV